MQPRINVITLGVRDFQKSLEFYRDGLGWKAQVQDYMENFPPKGSFSPCNPVTSWQRMCLFLQRGVVFPASR